MDKQFLNEAGLQKVADNVNKRLKTVETMPVNPKDGQIVLYVGESGMVYTQGCIYQFDESEDEWMDITSSGTVDQNFNPLSSNAQSGVAVNEAKTVLFNKLFSKEWKPITFNMQVWASNIWNDGINTYHSQAGGQYVFDESTLTWNTMTWGGTGDWGGYSVWKSASGRYYAKGDYDIRLDVPNHTWEQITWVGDAYPAKSNVWICGNNTYSSDGYEHYVLSDEEHLTWTQKTWQGLSEFYGNGIWTDGTNTYYSSGSNQYKLDVATDTWETMVWTGLTNFSPNDMWTDGDNIYYSSGSEQYVLNKATSTWEPKVWNNVSGYFEGRDVWHSPTNVYWTYDLNNSKLTTTLKTYID